MSQEHETSRARVLYVAIAPRLVGIVEGQALFEMDAGGDQLALSRQREPQSIVRPEQQHRLLLPLGEAQHLFCKCEGRLKLCAIMIDGLEPAQDRKELGKVPELLTQRVRPLADGFYVRSPIALDGNQRYS